MSEIGITPPEKKIIPSSPNRHNSSTSIRPRRTAATATKSRGFCRRLGDCIVMGPASTRSVDLSRYSINLDQLAQQAEEIKKELVKQKGLTCAYKAKLENAQLFLKHCLQVAQDNGFLDLVLNKEKYLDFLLSPTLTRATISPRVANPDEFHRDLAPLVDQAKINGWYIDPQEVEMLHLSAQGTTADIYRAKWRGLDVAIKCMYPEFFRSNENGAIFFGQEVETLSRQRHPFVLQLMGACLEPPRELLDSDGVHVDGPERVAAWPGEEAEGEKRASSAIEGEGVESLGDISSHAIPA